MLPANEDQSSPESTRRRNARRVTIYTIAERVGLSPSAVSLALRDSEQVSQETCARVKVAARDLGYEPNLMARGLRTRRTGAIAVILPNIHDPWMGAQTDPMQVEAARHGYEFVVVLEDDAALAGQRALDLLNRGQVDGVAISGRSVLAIKERLPAREDGFCPKVVASCESETESQKLCMDAVFIDFYPGAYAAMSHLARLGHRRVGYLHPSQRDLAGTRLEAYRQACADFGLDDDPALIAYVPLRPGAGCEGAHQLMDLARRPTAIYCCGDYLAFEAMRAAAEQGLSVPEDLAVIGTGNVPMAGYTAVSLTTIDCFPTLAGQQAIRILLRRLADPDAEREVYTIHPQLVVRESCGRRPRRMTG
jgi:DNA-binding LacI/PurR family transcriptional regulator